MVNLSKYSLVDLKNTPRMANATEVIYIQLFASLSSETVFFIGREAISISEGPVEKVERVTCILD